MKKPTHFIEIFKSGELDRLIHSPLNPIKMLDKSLASTKDAATLKTIAVWKIKFKR